MPIVTPCQAGPMMRKSEALHAPRQLVPIPTPEDPPEEFLRSFVATMPPHYRGYEPATLRAHAAIVYQRGNASVAVGAWRRLAGGGVAICVVAADRPGLLSLIAAALTSHDLDVIAAQIYTRTMPSGRAEAVDLFWLRRRPLARSHREITDDEVATVESLLADLIAGDESAGKLVQSSVVEVPYSAPGMTSVRFADNADGAAVLVVQTFDRPGLLLTISRCLFCLDIQVVRSDVNTSQGRVLDRFYLIDFDRRPIAEERRGQIEAAVLAAVENLGRRPS
jgi:UTP:GlnB (protein PII) uridylyltransferase